MGVVKGSKQERLDLIRHNPWQKYWRIGYVAVLVVVAILFFLMGQNIGISQKDSLMDEREQLRSTLSDSEKDLLSFSQRIAILEKGGEVDSQAAESVRQTIKDLRSEVAVLEEQISFYKGIMSPVDKSKGLTIHSVDFQPTGLENSYRYSIMMTQVSNHDRHTKGSIIVSFIGTVLGENKTLQLKNLDSKIPDDGLKYNFQYFQEERGEVIFPADFKVTQVKVVLKPSSSRIKKVVKTIEWINED